MTDKLIFLNENATPDIRLKGIHKRQNRENRTQRKYQRDNTGGYHKVEVQKSLNYKENEWEKFTSWQTNVTFQNIKSKEGGGYIKLHQGEKSLPTEEVESD